LTTGGDLLVLALVARGVDTVFALPGIQLDGLFDALARSGHIRVVHTRHEQAASYMADGYARATGRPGVCIVVPGPGVLNAGAGLATAYATGSPVLCIAGHLFGGDAARGTGALHEIPDQSAVIEGMIGATTRVTSADQIGHALDVAYTRLSSLPRRPAAIEIGPEVLAGPCDPGLAATTTSPPLDLLRFEPPLEADPAAIEEAAGLLAAARRPVIVAGGGCQDAGFEVEQLARALGAPVVVTPQGKGALSAGHSWVLPPVGAFPLLERCDALLVIGSRFTSTTGPPPVNPDATVIRIDADPARLTGAAAISIRSSAAAACRDLAAALGSSRPADPERDRLNLASAAELRSAIDAGLAAQFPDTYAYCRALRDVLADDDILVDEMTQVGYMARNAYPARRPHTYLGSGYQGTLGFGYPTALGAKVGKPERAVVSISGDGGFLYNAGELATAVHHGIAVVSVIFTDDAYGNVKGIQSRYYGREIASTLTNPDFVALAASFGIKGWRATSADELRPALEQAVESGEPAMIEVPITDQPDIGAVMSGRHRLTPHAQPGAEP
jgi:acetolactate synthase-1/2/3 large subunit